MLDDITLQSIGILEELPLPTFQNPPFPTQMDLSLTGTDNSLELLFGNGSVPSLSLP